jgi:hypothetical protein
VVQDPLVLAKARAGWAPVDRLGAKIDGNGQQMDQHGKAMAALGNEMQALGKEMDRAAGRMEFGLMNRAADAAVRELIRDAHARGLAQSAPVQG